MRTRQHDPQALRGIARDTRHLDPRTAAPFLVCSHRYATAPNVLRTDREFDECRRYARAIRARLDAGGSHYVEDEDGRLWAA